MRKFLKTGIAIFLVAVFCVVAFLLWPKSVEDIAIGETAVLRHTVRLEDGVKLNKGDMVCVLYEQEDSYYVLTPVEGAVYTYVPKSALTTDPELMAKANYASISMLAEFESVTGQHEYIYDGDEKGYTTVRVLERGEEWSIVEEGDVEWRVKSEELLTFIDPTWYSVDLSYLDLQQKADAGEEIWRLSAHEVAQRYALEAKNIAMVAEDPWEKGTYVKKFCATDVTGKQHNFYVYQPVKKDESGIWVICDFTLRERQIESVLPADAILLEEMRDRGSGYDIEIKPERTVYVLSESSGYGQSAQTLGTLQEVAEKYNLDLSPYYGKALEIYMLDYEWQESENSGIFAFEGNDLVWHFIFNNEFEYKIAEATLQEWKWGVASDYYAAFAARYGEE